MDQQAVALKENNPSTHTAQQNNGNTARAHRRRRRRRNKKQQQDNSHQPDAFDANPSREQLTPGTSKEKPTIVEAENSHHHPQQQQQEEINKMPARFAEEVITADPATTRTAPQLDLGGGHYVPRQQQLNDEIVISGFSGRLPESSNIEEFKQNLFDGVDMVNDDPRRWERGKCED